MKILYIVPYTPTSIRTRPYNLIRSLARQGHEVILATVWENVGEADALAEFREKGVQVLSVPLSRVQITKNLANALLNRKPLQSRYSWQPELAYKIAGWINNNHDYCDIIHIEHLRGAIYGLYLQSSYGYRKNHRQKSMDGAIEPRFPLLWDSVDNISSLFQQAAQRSDGGFGRWITRFELPLTRRYETDLIKRFDSVLVTSSVDQAAFEALELGNNVSSSRNSSPFVDKPASIQVLSNGVDLEAFKPSGRPRSSDTLVFSGKLSYHANVSSAIYLVEQVMPLVWAHYPQVRLQLVGKDPHPSLLKLAEEREGIEVTGTVPDLCPYLQQASLAAVTLTYGAGVQNKVLEAMACATPVVSTSRAVAALHAIPGQDVLVSDEPAGLAEHILKLLEDRDYNRQIGENGLRYVRRWHDWDKITTQLTTIYENVRETFFNTN